MRRLLLAALLGAFALRADAAVIVVDTTERGVSGPLCDIGDALNAANTDQISGGCTEADPSGADVIDLTGLTGTIAIEGDVLPVITESVTLRGPGADLLAIDGGDLSEIFVIEDGIVVIEGLTIANGSSGRGGCIAVTGAALVLRDSRVTGCVGFNGGAISVDEGATALIERSLLDANTTSGNSGAAIVNGSGTLRIVASTISGNFTTGEDRFGGGVATFAPDGPGVSTTEIYSSTIADNGADFGGNLYTAPSDAVTILSHTLLANPRLGGNCDGPVESEGFNLSTDGTCALGETSDLPNTSAGIGAALADAGGPTFVHVLEAGSAAIEGGSAVGCTDASGEQIEFDQRGPGFPRRKDADLDGAYECDIGAYEAAPEPLASLGGATALLGLAIAARARRR